MSDRLRLPCAYGRPLVILSPHEQLRHRVADLLITAAGLKLSAQRAGLSFYDGDCGPLATVDLHQWLTAPAGCHRLPRADVVIALAGDEFALAAYPSARKEFVTGLREVTGLTGHSDVLICPLNTPDGTPISATLLSTDEAAGCRDLLLPAHHDHPAETIPRPDPLRRASLTPMAVQAAHLHSADDRGGLTERISA